MLLHPLSFRRWRVTRISPGSLLGVSGLIALVI